MNDYTVLARKYRPHNFEEVVGQEHVVQAMKNSITSRKLHSVYLLSGTRGVGKTTIARIFTKAMNCKNFGKNQEPCEQCDSCKSINEGRCIDLLEVDAASQTGVNETRNMIESLNYTPQENEYKVFIIDEVHMLSIHSFNALLKTLEEPPEYAKFLLCTTDPQKIPATVLSRCLHFHLKPLTPEQIDNQLSKILDKENIPKEAEATRILANAANGSMRDCLSLADQAIAIGNQKVTKSSVQAMLGIVDDSNLVNLIKNLLDPVLINKDRIGIALKHFDEISKQQTNWFDVTNQILDLIFQVNLYAISQNITSYERENQELKNFCNQPTLDKVVLIQRAQTLYDIFSHSLRNLQYSTNPYQTIKLAIIRALAFTPNTSVVLQKSAESKPKKPKKKEKRNNQETTKNKQLDAASLEHKPSFSKSNSDDSSSSFSLESLQSSKKLDDKQKNKSDPTKPNQPETPASTLNNGTSDLNNTSLTKSLETNSIPQAQANGFGNQHSGFGNSQNSLGSHTGSLEGQQNNSAAPQVGFGGVSFSQPQEATLSPENTALEHPNLLGKPQDSTFLKTQANLSSVDPSQGGENLELKKDHSSPKQHSSNPSTHTSSNSHQAQPSSNWGSINPDLEDLAQQEAEQNVKSTQSIKINQINSTHLESSKDFVQKTKVVDPIQHQEQTSKAQLVPQKNEECDLFLDDNADSYNVQLEKDLNKLKQDLKLLKDGEKDKPNQIKNILGDAYNQYDLQISSLILESTQYILSLFTQNSPEASSQTDSSSSNTSSPNPDQSENLGYNAFINLEAFFKDAYKNFKQGVPVFQQFQDLGFSENDFVLLSGSPFYLDQQNKILYLKAFDTARKTQLNNINYAASLEETMKKHAYQIKDLEHLTKDLPEDTAQESQQGAYKSLNEYTLEYLTQFLSKYRKKLEGLAQKILLL